MYKENNIDIDIFITSRNQDKKAYSLLDEWTSHEYEEVEAVLQVHINICLKKRLKLDFNDELRVQEKLQVQGQQKYL